LHKLEINSSYLNFKDFTLDIENHFTTNQNTIHKARNELKILSHNNTNIVVKSFKKPNFINRIVYTFLRSSKAKKSYEHSLKIEQFTPQPISYIEYYVGGLLEKSYFISEQFNYDFTIREPLLDDNFASKEEILRAFARFTLELHNKGIFHNDYSPGNILIKKEDGVFTFKIVDINRMKFFNLSELDRAKNFSKLWARDDELHIMADEYTKYYKSNMDFSSLVCKYSNHNKQFKNFKKRLKGKTVND